MAAPTRRIISLPARHLPTPRARSPNAPDPACSPRGPAPSRLVAAARHTHLHTARGNAARPVWRRLPPQAAADRDATALAKGGVPGEARAVSRREGRRAPFHVLPGLVLHRSWGLHRPPRRSCARGRRWRFRPRARSPRCADVAGAIAAHARRPGSPCCAGGCRPASAGAGSASSQGCAEAVRPPRNRPGHRHGGTQSGSCPTSAACSEAHRSVSSRDRRLRRFRVLFRLVVPICLVPPRLRCCIIEPIASNLQRLPRNRTLPRFCISACAQSAAGSRS